MTATWSTRLSASSWSWVTKMAVAPAARRMVRTSERTRTRRPASRLEKGSSSRTRSGSGARARARATRCCWPPLSSCGRRRSRPPRPTMSATSATRLSRVAGVAMEAKGDVLAHVQVGKEGVFLEDHADAPALGRQVEAAAGDAHAADLDAAAVERLEAGDQAQERGLAAAAGAEQGEQLALGQRQRDAVDGRDGAEMFRHVFKTDAGGRRHGWDQAGAAPVRHYWAPALAPVLSPIIGSPPGAGRQRSRAPTRPRAAVQGRRHGHRRLHSWPTRSRRRAS